MKAELVEIILQLCAAQNPSLPRPVLVEQRGEAQLYGRGGPLDSLGLVSLIVEVEAAVEDRFGQSVVLADERALSQHRSPIRTVDALADYIVAMLAERSVPPTP